MVLRVAVLCGAMRSRRMRLGVAAVTLAASIALPDVGVVAQDDPCSLIPITELEAVTGTIDTGAYPSDGDCRWGGKTVGDDIIDIELILDIGVDPAGYVGNYGDTQAVQVAGADGYLYAGIGAAIVAVRLASSTPLLSASTTGDQDAAAMATALLAVAVGRLAPDGVPPPTGPSTSPTPAPPPTFAGPTPLADVSDCARRIGVVDLTDPVTIDAVDECRFLDGGADVARDVLEAGGTRRSGVGRGVGVRVVVRRPRPAAADARVRGPVDPGHGRGFRRPARRGGRAGRPP